MRPLHIAMVGTRGVPATYGGVEHHVQALGARLVERGHRVTVFAEEGYVGPDAPSSYRGMEIVCVPSVESKHLEAAVHAARSATQAIRRGVDVVHFHAIGPGWVSPLPRFFSRAAVVQTIHGLDAERAKWSGPAKAMLRGATWLAAHVPDRTITVSHTLSRRFAERWGRTCDVIPNGVETRRPRRPDAIRSLYGLEGQDYVLSLGRLVPEKQVDRLVRAFADIDTDMRLVVAGGSSYTDGFVEELEQLAAADERVLMPGFVHGEVLDELLGNAAVFCQPSALEGLPLTLLEAIEARRPVVASAIPPHREVLATTRGESPGEIDLGDSSCPGQPGLVLHDPDDTESLRDALDGVLSQLPRHRAAADALADGVLSTYDWDAATDALEATYYDALGEQAPVREPVGALGTR